MANQLETSMTSGSAKEDRNDEVHAFVILDFLGDALDPAPLVALIPLEHGRTRKKGDLMTNRPSEDGRPVARAKTGVVCFSTPDQKALTGDAHLRFLLDIIEARLPAIKDLIAAQSLTWTAWFFEGDVEGHRFSDLSPDLVERAARIGMPLLLKADWFSKDDDPTPPTS
jgi:hypothetical protein